MRRKEGFVLREVAGEFLLVPIGARVLDMNGLVRLNATGACLWGLLDGEHSEADMVGEITRRFNVGSAEAEADVQVFLARLAGLGLLDQ